MSSGKKLTELEIAERIDFAKNHSREQFAEKYGMAYGSASVFYARHRIRNRPLRVQKDEFCDYAKNHLRTELCKHFGICYRTARHYEKLYNVECLKREARVISKPDVVVKKRTGLAHDMIVSLATEYSYASIARVFGYSTERIRQIVMERQS